MLVQYFDNGRYPFQVCYDNGRYLVNSQFANFIFERKAMSRKIENKEEMRKEIVRAAAKKFKEHGYHGVGVDGVMATANLTSGAFYRKFGSKAEIFREVLQNSSNVLKLRFDKWRAQTEDDWLCGALAEYLSDAHRSEFAEGCNLAALAADAARADDKTKSVVEEQIKEIVGEIQANVKADSATEAKQKALATLALMVGGITLARAMPDGETAAEMLKACRRLGEKLRE